MTQHRWDDDDHLLEDLAAALHATEPLAQTIAEHAEGALSWRTIDDDLLRASLTFDSSLAASAEVRAEPDAARVLVFTSTPLSVELEVVQAEVVGQILPPGPGEVRVETSNGATYDVVVDETGFFELPTLPAGAMRLRCDTATGRVVTDWVQL
ncbi:hypothetical protein OHA18_22980 [Kribbella sp. NBC_00709]|uniref:hypothetical protein n=1 Tax=Kribbella sp. NBC_00709 TaxID=2975972 RepID=UPI002E29C81C|nr:hypothetical protein [Kribbella sp. NBC_00709]